MISETFKYLKPKKEKVVKNDLYREGLLLAESKPMYGLYERHSGGATSKPREVGVGRLKALHNEVRNMGTPCF